MNIEISHSSIKTLENEEKEKSNMKILRIASWY